MNSGIPSDVAAEEAVEACSRIQEMAFRIITIASVVYPSSSSPPPPPTVAPAPLIVSSSPAGANSCFAVGRLPCGSSTLAATTSSPSTSATPSPPPPSSTPTATPPTSAICTTSSSSSASTSGVNVLGTCLLAKPAGGTAFEVDRGQKLIFKVKIWWAGLMRGAVSIALAYNKFTRAIYTQLPSNAVMITSTITVVLFGTIAMVGESKKSIVTS
ncbi:myc-associated zinc finger protein-like [Ananas comosus]|uniref:Myc-associated zinc finger protein-like n=1 Tax=Ananas comosus TaxID=4615 RepID=A0A6P5HIQ2_ANACO|nr:myc-associated zinc finger protein-like [Ananas comosus]